MKKKDMKSTKKQTERAKEKEKRNRRRRKEIWLDGNGVNAVTNWR